MRLFVALRLLSEQYVKPAVEATNQVDSPNDMLIDANVARHHPALKNICSFMTSAGILPEKRRGKVHSHAGVEREADLRLYWCEIDTQRTPDDWYSQQNVEVVIFKDEFVKFTASIRHKAGAAYVIACEKYAQTLRIGPNGDANSKPPFRSADQAA
jgi:hypothetical protein